MNVMFVVRALRDLWWYGAQPDDARMTKKEQTINESFTLIYDYLWYFSYSKTNKMLYSRVLIGNGNEIQLHALWSQDACCCLCVPVAHTKILYGPQWAFIVTSTKMNKVYACAIINAINCFIAQRRACKWWRCRSVHHGGKMKELKFQFKLFGDTFWKFIYFTNNFNFIWTF